MRFSCRPLIYWASSQNSLWRSVNFRPNTFLGCPWNATLFRAVVKRCRPPNWLSGTSAELAGGLAHLVCVLPWSRRPWGCRSSLLRLRFAAAGCRRDCRRQLGLRSPLCAALSTATSGRIAFLATRAPDGRGKPVLSIPMTLLTIGRRVAGGSRVSGALLWLLAVPAIIVDGAFRRRAALCAADRLDPTATCLTRASHIAALLPAHSIGRIAAIGDCAVDLNSGRWRRRATDFQVR